jgi:hypothetical protein
VNVDLVETFVYLAPGFLALKLFYLFGAQRPRSQWEWTTWSIVASLPLNGAAAFCLARLSIQSYDAQVVLALSLSLAAGVAAAVAWRQVRRSDRKMAVRLRLEVADSAWDQALEDATNKKRPIVVVMNDGPRYRGMLRYGGREDAQAEGWIYLCWPDKRDEETKEWTRIRGTHGLLIDRDRIRIVQVYLSNYESNVERLATDDMA